LVINVTNYVVMNMTANALLAIGASPVMAHALDELEEMVSMSQGLVINMGTLSDPWVQSMKKAIQVASRRGIPIVLDPVGAGATSYRLRATRELLGCGKVSVIRGNASEIFAISKKSEKRMKGVDSVACLESAYSAAKDLASALRCTVCVSGKTDLIVSYDDAMARTTWLENGHEIMTHVTGMGCVATALTGAFLAVQPDPYQATQSAMAIVGVAGEVAAQLSLGPGSFVPQFLDTLYHLKAKDFQTVFRGRLE
jgi:hydroxyethylthiazole kinase